MMSEQNSSIVTIGGLGLCSASGGLTESYWLN